MILPELIPGKGKPINILFIMNVMELGGSETLILNIIRNLDRSRWNPSVGWFNKKDPLSEFIELKIPLYHFPKVKRFDFKTITLISNVIKDNNIQIVNAHHYLSLLYSFYGAKIANESRLVYTEHSEEEIKRNKGKLRIIGHILAKYSDASIGVSEIIHDKLINHYHIRKDIVYTIRNGVDLNVFKENKCNILKRNNIGLKENDIVLGIVANLKKNKNHLFLLRAINKLVLIHPNLKLVVVGKSIKEDPDSSEDEIIQYIRDNSLKDHVILLGFRRDVMNILPLLDMFCLVSQREGLPISLLEAMAAGLPVIGTNSIGIRDVISHGENGFLVEDDDVEDLKDKILFLMENPVIRNKFGQKGRELVKNTYEIKKCVEGYERIFNRCLSVSNGLNI